jgi:hypothetical protein
MASDDQPQLPLRPWLFRLLVRNAPNNDVDRAGMELLKIQQDANYCLLQIESEKKRRAIVLHKHRVHAGLVRAIDGFSKI